MSIVTHCAVSGKLPTGKDVMVLLTEYAQQIARNLPDERLRRVLVKALCGIITHRSPVIARMVSVSSTPSNEPEGPAKQVRRFFANARVTTQCLWKGLYQRTRTSVDAERPTVVPAVIDSLNLEKPYARKMPGLSTIRKPMPPNRRHKATQEHNNGRKQGRKDRRKQDHDLTKGFPALAVVALTRGLPALTFGHLFSYVDDHFTSVKREIRRAILTTSAVLAGYTVRFIADREFDDDQVLLWMAQRGNQFLVRAYHHRVIDAYDEATKTWRRTSLQECSETLSLLARFTATFTHARKKRTSLVRLGACRIRIPSANNLECWLIVGHALIFKKPLWLLTNVPLPDLDTAVALWWQYRDRPDVEDLFRLLQERGLDIEDIRLRAQDRIEKLVAVVWAAAQFLWQLSLTAPPVVQRWLRRLGGKEAESRGSDRLYLLLYGLSALLLEYLVLLLRQHCEKAWLVSNAP